MTQRPGMLDPQVEKLLAWAAKAGGPSYPEIGAAAARAHYERIAATLDIDTPRPRPLDFIRLIGR